MRLACIRDGRTIQCKHLKHDGFGAMINWRNALRWMSRASAQPNMGVNVVQSHLFSPGDGQAPVHVAGREHEMNVLRRMLARLADGASPAHNAALHAPRGMGKSVLLHETAKQSEGTNVCALLLPASVVPTLESLYKRTLGQPVPSALQSEKSAGGRVGGKRLHIHGDAKQTTQMSGMDAGDWQDALEQQCTKRPMLLLIDEAHTLDLDVAHVLLNASQHLRRNAPFALVIAGTPGLEAHITKAETTFWERLASGDMRLGLLSQDEAQDALRTPLQDADMGLPFDEDAIAEMAKRSDGYPYFVQLWGEQAELHSRRHDDARITMETVQAIEPIVTRMRNDLYRKRWNEMCGADIREAVESVAPLLTEPNAIITNDDAKGIMGSQQRLDDAVRLGALQHGREVGTVQAGIPSLMQYVMEAQARLERLKQQARTPTDSANHHAHPKPWGDH